jgi:FkbM family methyltransferase
MKLKVYIDNQLRNYSKKWRQYRNTSARQKQSDYYISYSQSGEDIIVEFIFKNLLNKPKFTYCDIGAHHSTYISNTALFYKKGMTGICIEPDPTLFEEIQKNRANDICLNCGIGFSSDKDLEEELDFFIMSAKSLNTFSREEAERLDKQGEFKIQEIRKIKTLNINKVFERYYIPDFLSVDVEGIDFEIIKSIDLINNRPKVICVETAEFSPVPPGTKTYESVDYLKEKGYIYYADTYNNSIMLDNEYLQKMHKSDHC